MTKTDLPISLHGLKLGLSGAVPERKHWTESAQDRGILEFVALLSGLVFKYGGNIAHGAHPTFTPIVLRQSELHAPQNATEKPAKIYMSELWAKSLPPYEKDRFERESEFVVVPQVGDGGVDNPYTRNSSLTAMRHVLVNRINVLVAVGGMRHEGTAMTPGVAEELELARRRGMACFVIGGLGGEAAKIAKDLKLGPDSLKNELPTELNHELLTSDNISACVGIIFNQLVQHLDLAQRDLVELS